MKKVQLTERGPKGRFIKNRGYFYEQLKTKVRDESDGYFKHLLLGRIRKNVLDVIFKVFEKLTDQDVEGKGDPQ